MAAVPNDATRLTEYGNEVQLVGTKFDERCSSLEQITSSNNPGRIYTVDDAIEEIDRLWAIPDPYHNFLCALVGSRCHGAYASLHPLSNSEVPVESYKL